MKQSWTLVAVLILSSCASIAKLGTSNDGGGGGGNAATGGGAGGGGEDVRARFPVQDLVLGTKLSALAAQGFTCGPDRGNSMPTCVKILDERCKGRKLTVRAIAMNVPPPEGRGCVYDSATGATLLDHEKTTIPMSLVAVKGTDTSAPRAFEIEFDFAMNTLDGDSKLSKALVAKYGKPSLTNPPSQLAWESGDVQLQAICGSSTADWGQYCHLLVTDNRLLESERSLQKAAEQAKANQAEAPKL